MKKRLTAICLGLMALPLWANPQATSATDKIFKEFIIQDNNLNKCLFPEVYESNDRGAAVLEKWWNDTENNGRMKRAHYLKLKLRLSQKIMPEEWADKFHFGELDSALEKQYETALKKYEKTTTVNSSEDCEKIGQYATDLIEQYDEINEKWR